MSADLKIYLFIIKTDQKTFELTFKERQNVYWFHRSWRDITTNLVHGMKLEVKNFGFVPILIFWKDVWGMCLIFWILSLKISGIIPFFVLHMKIKFWKILSLYMFTVLSTIIGSRYSRMDKVKIVEESLLLGPFLNTLTQINIWRCINVFNNPFFPNAPFLYHLKT